MTETDDKALNDEELEEGELSSEEEEGSKQPEKLEKPERQERESRSSAQPQLPAPIRHPAESQYAMEDMDAEEGDGDDRRMSRRRRKKEHKKRKRDGREKKGHRPPKYVDHDQIAEEFGTGEYNPDQPSWSGAGGFGNRSPPGPYDSPHGSNSEDADDAWNKPRRKRNDKFSRPAPGPYDSPYESPSGAYDSPSEHDEYGPPPKLKRMNRDEEKQSRSMMSMVDEEYMDANVAANEREEIFDRRKRGPISAAQRRRMEKNRQYHEKRRELTKGEKKALKSVNEQRPMCKFFMDGKCNKGYDCQFSHSFEPPKKFEVCKFYISDSCTKGRDCLYVHSEFPCRFHHKHGYCERGDDCKFSHAELTDQTRDWLMQSAGFIAREEERLESDGIIPPLQKIRKQDEDLRPHKKPLLSTPPHHPDMMDPMGPHGPGDMKKIPSLFEINTFGGGGGGNYPRNPGPQGPGPMGPGPFYNDMNGPPRGPPGPGILGPGPPMNGPMMPGPHQQGGPGMMRPPMNQGPQGFYDNYYMEGNNGNMQQDQNPEFNQNHGPMDSNGGPNVPFDVSHLPPKQRELFMRIQQQQHNNTMSMNNEQKPDDDNWYSDEEDEEKKNAQNAANLLQNMRQNSGPMGGSVNIASMLSAIRQRMGPANNANGQPGIMTSPQDPRSRPADPRKPRNDKSDLEIKCYGFKVKYALKRITVDGRPSLPLNIVKHDPKYKDDPRVDKYYQPNISSLPPMMDHKKKSDPRLRRSSTVMKEDTPGSPPPYQKPPSLTEAPAMPADLLSPPADLKLQKTLSLPLDEESSRGSGSWSKPRSSRSSRSNSESSEGGEKRLDYRNDPRFRKRKSQSTDEAPKSEEETGEPSYVPKSRRDQVDFESPLAVADDSDNKDSSYSAYNRPPNENFHKVLLSGSNSDPRMNRSRGSPPSLAEGEASSVILPEQMEVPPSLPKDEPSLKDMFKTIDPTASPFC